MGVSQSPSTIRRTLWPRRPQGTAAEKIHGERDILIFHRHPVAARRVFYARERQSASESPEPADDRLHEAGRRASRTGTAPGVVFRRCRERRKEAPAAGHMPGTGARERFRQRPTLPGSLPPSTIGAGGLNCRVRDGNGCFPAAMATGNLAPVPAQCTAIRGRDRVP